MQSLHLVQQSDHLDPWLAFVGAILVALIAAVTAQARLRAQLYAEDKRHRDELKFQRGETDRAELRTILDAIGEHLNLMLDAVGEVISTASVLDMAEDDPEHEEYWTDWLDERTEELRRETDEVANHAQRLRLRLGPEGDSLVASAEYARMYAAAIRHNLSCTTPPPRDVDKAREMRDTSRKQAERYFDDALELTKAQLHVEAPAPSPPASRRPAHAIFLSSCRLAARRRNGDIAVARTSGPVSRQTGPEVGRAPPASGSEACRPGPLHMQSDRPTVPKPAAALGDLRSGAGAD